MTVYYHLLDALKVAKSLETISKDSTLTAQIGGLINQRFPGNEITVQDIVRGTSTVGETTSTTTSIAGWKEWNPSKEALNNQTSSTAEQVAADKTDEGEEDVLELISSMNDQQVLDYFKTVKNMKLWAKTVGLEVDHTFEADDFIMIFQSAVKDAMSDPLKTK